MHGGRGVSVVTDGGNLDYNFGPGLRPASDYDYPVSAAWIGHVGLGGVDVSVLSDDYQVAARVLGSARLEGQEIPDLSDGIYVVGSDGVERPALPLDAAGGYGERIEARGKRDEYAYAEQVDATHWRAAATVGDRRIVVTAPTPALAELVAGSARVQQRGGDGAWQTVTYEGDPVNESGDNTVVLDLPPGWERLGHLGLQRRTSLRAGRHRSVRRRRLGDLPPGVHLRLRGRARPRALRGGGTSGYVFVGALAAQVVDAPDHETARRILASVRLPGEPAPGAAWRTEDLGDGTVELPADDAVSIRVAMVDLIRSPDGVEQGAARQQGEVWVAGADYGVGTSVRVTAPTQALADVVASTVRPAD